MSWVFLQRHACLPAVQSHWPCPGPGWLEQSAPITCEGHGRGANQRAPVFRKAQPQKHANETCTLTTALTSAWLSWRSREGDREAGRLQRPRLTSGTSSFPPPEMKTPVRHSESPSGHLHLLWLRVHGHAPHKGRRGSVQVPHVADRGAVRGVMWPSRLARTNARPHFTVLTQIAPPQGRGTCLTGRA